MTMRIAFALTTLVLTAAARPAPDPLLDQLIAGARSVPPSSITFERTVRTVSEENGGGSSTRTRIDRWDGKQLVPLSIDGKSPTPEQLADFKKNSSGRPIAGYHRLADFLKAGAVRVSDSQGRTVYKISKLPKGTVNVGKDISANLVGEAIVDSSGPKPYVSRFRTYLPKPLSFFMVAKLDSFEQVNEYRLSGDGKPVQVRSVQSMAGTQFGKSGSTRTEANFTVGR